METLRGSVLASVCLAVLAVSSPSVRVKLKPKPVRAALERRYAHMRAGYIAGDMRSVLDVRAPNFFAVQASGATWDSAQSAEYTRLSFEQVERTLTLTIDLDTIRVDGDTAAAEVSQHWVRRQRKAGRIRLVDTSARQRETWVRLDGTWMLWRIDRVQPGVWIVDGKRVDPSKPYDPDAPPYRPGP